VDFRWIPPQARRAQGVLHLRLPVDFPRSRHADHQLHARVPHEHACGGPTLGARTALRHQAARRSQSEVASSRSQIAAAAQASDGAYVAAVLDFFRTGGFEYSLTPPRLGFRLGRRFHIQHPPRVLRSLRFRVCLAHARRGCSRPRRDGLSRREWNPIGRYFIVRQSDAHSWAEVWLEGRGWTRVDPTGVVEPERLRRGILDLLPTPFRRRHGLSGQIPG